MFIQTKILKQALLALTLFGMVAAYAQTQLEAQVKMLDSATQTQLFELLAMDCGTDDGINNFNTAVQRLPPDSVPVFISVLQQGTAPESLQNTTREQLSKRYRERQEWIKQHGSDLFDQQTLQQMSQQSLDEYLQAAMRKLNIRYQENAIRALGQRGDARAVDAIRQATKMNNQLGILAQEAINTINQRRQ